MAIELERGKPKSEPNRFPDSVLGAGPSQPQAGILHEKATREAYNRMIRTAYEPSFHCLLSLAAFKVPKNEWCEANTRKGLL